MLGAALFSFSFCYFLLLSVRNDIAKLIFDDLLAIAFCPKSLFLKQKLVHPAPPPASTPTTPEHPPCRGCHLHTKTPLEAHSVRGGRKATAGNGKGTATRRWKCFSGRSIESRQPCGNICTGAWQTSCLPWVMSSTSKLVLLYLNLFHPCIPFLFQW